MPALIDFADAVTASNLDPNQTHAVYYVDGRFANRDAVAAQCPHAKLYGITVFGATGPGIFAADSETGDMTVDEVVAWAEEQIKLGVRLICVYANLSRFLNEGLLARLQALEKKYGVKIRKWLAHYTGNPVLEFPWVDAEQYADPGPIDLNVALANFFGDEPQAHTVDPHYNRFDARPRLVYKKARRERGQVELYDRLRAQQTPTKHPHRAQLAFVRCVLRFYAGRVWAIAHIKRVNGQASWDVNSRGFRYQELVKRANGQRVV
jgi:hypothetical protein